MKVQSTKKILLSIAFLVLLLVATFYAMQYVRSPSFQNGLGMLFGPAPEPARTWNWCPPEVTEVTLQDKTYRTAGEIDLICRVEIEPLEQMSQEDFRPLAEAKMPDRKVILETNPSLEIFRVEGLPFRSKKLTEFVKGQRSESQ